MESLFRNPPSVAAPAAKPRGAFDATGGGQSSTRARIGLAKTEMLRRAGEVERGLLAARGGARGNSRGAVQARSAATAATAGLSLTLAPSRNRAAAQARTRPARRVSEKLCVGGNRGNRPTVQVEIRNRCGNDRKQYRPTASRKVPAPTPSQFTDYLPASISTLRARRLRVQSLELLREGTRKVHTHTST